MYAAGDSARNKKKKECPKYSVCVLNWQQASMETSATNTTWGEEAILLDFSQEGGTFVSWFAYIHGSESSFKNKGTYLRSLLLQSRRRCAVLYMKFDLR